MSSASSAVTYTSVYTDSEPGRVFWGADDEEISEGGILRVIVLGYDIVPIQPVALPSPDYIPGAEDPQTPPVPQDEDEREPGRAGINVRLRLPFPSTEAKRPLHIHSPPPVPSPLLPSSGCPTQIQTLRISSTQAFIDAVIVVLPSPPLPPLPPSLYIPPPVDHKDDIPKSEQPPRKRLCLSTLGYRYEIRESSTARSTRDREVDYGFVSTIDAEARQQGISEVGYGIRDTWVGPAEAVPEIAPMTATHQELQTHRDHVYAHETHLQAHQTQLQLHGTLIQTQHHVHETRFQMQQAEIAVLRETDRRHQAQMVETLRMMRDMSQEMGDMQTELLALRGQRRARQPAQDTRIPDHQDLASWDADSHTPHLAEERQSDNKRKADDSSRNNHGHQQQPFKRQNVIKVNNMGIDKKKPYGDLCPSAPSAIFQMACDTRSALCNKVGHFASDFAGSNGIQMLLILRSGNGGSSQGQKWLFWSVEHQGISREIVLKKRGDASGNPDSNVVTENSYESRIADGKIVRIDTIIRGCTLNFLDHPFHIDLMPIELGSFDVIIGMDWLRRCHAVIVCDEKLVQVPYGNETLTFCGNKSSNRRESRLTVISCSKAQEYMAKGCQVFLAQISAKKEEDKSEGKQIKDVPIVRDFPEVFPEDLPGLPLARAPYRLAPSEMKELSEQLQELSDKGFHKAVLPLGSLGLVFQKEGWVIQDVHWTTRRYEISINSLEYESKTFKDGISNSVWSYVFQVCNSELTNAPADKKEHEEHLKAILELLKKEKLYAKFSKCEFWIPKVQFLGHVIYSRGIHVDPTKIESIKDWAFL
ncbi:putative reverse transcriptase domain-containing protein [Tanacetum coccineum]